MVCVSNHTFRMCMIYNYDISQDAGAFLLQGAAASCLALARCGYASRRLSIALAAQLPRLLSGNGGTSSATNSREHSRGKGEMPERGQLPQHLLREHGSARNVVAIVPGAHLGQDSQEHSTRPTSGSSGRQWERDANDLREALRCWGVQG